MFGSSMALSLQSTTTKESNITTLDSIEIDETMKVTAKNLQFEKSIKTAHFSNNFL